MIGGNLGLEFKPLPRNDHYRSVQFTKAVNSAFLKLFKKVTDQKLSPAMFLNFAEDGSTDLAKRSVHLISAKMNGKTRIVAVSFPEKSDQFGLRDNFMKKLKEFPLTFDQLRTGDIKCLNICADGAPGSGTINFNLIFFILKMDLRSIGTVKLKKVEFQGGPWKLIFRTQKTQGR